MQEIKFKTLTCSEQLASDSEIESLLQKEQRGETENTISVNEALMIANMLISRINQIVPMRSAQGTYAYTTKGDGTEHKFNDCDCGTRIGIVVTDNCYKMTISREQIDDSNCVKIGLDQNVKHQIEEEIVNAYKRSNGVEFK